MNMESRDDPREGRPGVSWGATELFVFLLTCDVERMEGVQNFQMVQYLLFLLK